MDVIRFINRVILVALLFLVICPQQIFAQGGTASPASHEASIAGQKGMSVPDYILTSYLTPAQVAQWVADMQSLGVIWFRVDIARSAIEYAPGMYSWTTYDSVVNAITSRGMKVLGIIDQSPAWASVTGSCCWGAPVDPEGFGEYAGQVAEHYAPLGVHTWEIWNEPNNVNFFQPSPNVATYTQLLSSAYTAIKQADPSAFVVTGGTAPEADDGTNIAPITFLQGIYAQGGKGFFDAVGHHPYSYPNPPGGSEAGSAWAQMSKTTPNLRSVMVDNADGAKKIWMTEFGAPTDGPAGGPSVTEQAQSTMLRQAYRLAQGYSWAGPLIWYTYHDSGTDTGSVENFFGIIRNDGTLKPAYSTYKTVR